MKVAVVGSGYVGLNLAVLAASKGFQVSVIDTNEKLVSKLKNGNSHIEGIDDEILNTLLEQKVLKFFSNFEVLNTCDFVVIAVPTPLNLDKTPDLSNLNSAVASIAENVAEHTLVINESTSFPGTLRSIEQFVRDRNSAKTLYFAVCPERIDPGNKTWEIKNTPRILSGSNPQSIKMAIEFYERLGAPIRVVDTPEIAEAAKLFENTFRFVNIALVSELAHVCKALKVPVLDVLDAAESKPFGFMRFNPSLGVGGHCIPVDPIYLSWAAKHFGYTSRLIELSDEILRENATSVIELVRNEIGGSLRGKRIQLLGVTYKKGISDTRETPARDLILGLEHEGATVSWHDPLIQNWKGQTSTPISTQLDFGLIYSPHSEINFSIWENVDFPVRYCGPGRHPNFKSIFEND